MSSQEAVTLFRPTGEQEFVLIRDSGWRMFPPRLPDQPFFYPVLNEEYAAELAAARALLAGDEPLPELTAPRG